VHFFGELTVLPLQPIEARKDLIQRRRLFGRNLRRGQGNNGEE